MTVNNSSLDTYSGTITNGSNALSLVKTGAGNLTLAAADTYTGSTTISAGTLSISADNNLGNAPGSATPGWLTINGGTLATTSSFLLNSNRGIAVGSSVGTIDVAGATTLTYNGIIANVTSQVGAFVDADTGILVLGGANSYTGSTAVNAGTLPARHRQQPADGHRLDPGQRPKPAALSTCTATVRQWPA